MLTLLGVSIITFLLAFVIPADPARTVAGPKADRETLAQIRREMHLDQPVLLQYGLYVGRLLRGDLGRSYVTRQDIREAIIARVPATAFLAAVSLLLAVSVGLAAGCVTAVSAGRTTDLVVLIVSLVILSLPVFWVGMLLLYGIAYRLRWLPLGGYGGPAHVILPACALALAHAAYYARLVHSTMTAILAEDYVRTARSKGLSAMRVYGKHALRNALIPVTTVIGLDCAGLMSGVVLTETVFNWPGLGRLAVDAVFNQDIPMIMGTVSFGALLVIAANVVVDALYVVIDPRMRGGGRTTTV